MAIEMMFGHHNRPITERILVIAQDLTIELWWQRKTNMVFSNFLGWISFLKQESWENLGKFAVSTKFPIFWINFTKQLIQKKEKKDCGMLPLALKIFLQRNVHWVYSITWYLWPFIKTFCSLTSMDTWIFQHVKILTKKHSSDILSNFSNIRVFYVFWAFKKILENTWYKGQFSSLCIFIIF